MEQAPRPEKEPPSGRWTPEKVEQLIKCVHGGLLKPNWEEIAVLVDQSASGCAKKYNESVPIEEQVQNCMLRLSDSDIIQLVSEKRANCETCDEVLYMPLMEWRGVKECPKCHSVHKDEIDALWKTISPHTVCLYCDRERGCGIPFHYDHLNMFEKGDSVCSMVHRGASVEDIVMEIKKCQVLCKSCHEIVTHFENILGFRKLKVNLTRESNGTCKSGELMDNKEAAVKQAEYAELYKRTFAQIYPKIKELVHCHKS